MEAKGAPGLAGSGRLKKRPWMHMTKYFHSVVAKHRNDIERKGKRLEGSPPHPHPGFSCILRDVINAPGMFLRAAGSGIVGVALHTPPPGERGGSEGEHAGEPLGHRSETGADPGPRSGQSRLPSGDPARPRCSPHRLAEPRRGRRGPTPAGGAEADAPGPSSPAQRLTERRGARWLPGEHAPAARARSSVRGKACAPPPGFRARS